MVLTASGSGFSYCLGVRTWGSGRAWCPATLRGGSVGGRPGSPEEPRSCPAFPFKVSSVAFSPDGARVLSGNQDDTVKLCGTRPRVRCCARLRGIPSEGVLGYVLTRRHPRTGGQRRQHDQAVTLPGVLCCGPSRDIPAASTRSRSRPTAPACLSGGNDNPVRLWDVATGALLRTFEGHSNGSPRSYSRPTGLACCRAAGTRQSDRGTW